MEILLSYYIDPNKITKITTAFENRMMELSNISRTAKLWINFRNYVHTIQMFITASRTGEWNLTLVTMESMIDLFAVTGHTNYARCLRLHLKFMLHLKDSHPQVHEKFAQQGAHVKTKSERYWAGLWPDLIIEQVMMKSVKSRGGLTHGRWLTESAKTLWVNSQNVSSLIYSAMTSLTGSQTVSSHHHEELGVTQQKRDAEDLDKISSWFKIHNLFDSNKTELQSLSTGLIADDKINCDETESLGCSIQMKPDNLKFSEASIKRKDRVTTLASLNNQIKVKDRVFPVGPVQLFSRLILIMERSDYLIQYFKYELTPEPTSVFKDQMMRKDNKASLLPSLIQPTYQHDDKDDESIPNIVIDGGYLLRIVVWLKDGTYNDVLQR